MNKKRTLAFYTSFHIYLPFIYLFRNKRKNGILLFFKERKNYVKKKKMKIINFALTFVAILCIFNVHFIHADDDVEVIDVEDDGSSSVATKAPKEDLLPAFYESIGLKFLNGAALQNRVSSGGRRGVASSKDIEPNSEVMRTPVSSIISMGGVQKYPDLTKALTSLEVTATIGLAVFITYERYHVGEASQYFKYLESLPEGFGTVQYWQEEELKTLIGSPLLGEAQTRARATQDDFNRLKQVLCSGDSPVMSEEEFSFEHFSWAVGNVFARSLLLSIQDTGSMVPVLLPGFDEFELTIQNASKITLENDTVVLKSLTGAKAGNSLFVNNGYKGNDGLLLNHGTYVESNPYDGVPMNIRMSRDDPLYDTKDKMIKTLGMNVDTPFRLMANANGTVPAAMLRSLRVQLMRFKEMDRFGALARQNKPISLYNEVQVFKTILLACDEMLKGYPTNITADDAELRKFAEGAKDGEIKATRPIVGILHRRMEKQTLLRTKIWIYETWTRLLTEGDMTDYLEHYN
jgi:hypothetical protein